MVCVVVCCYYLLCVLHHQSKYSRVRNNARSNVSLGRLLDYSTWYVPVINRRFPLFQMALEISAVRLYTTLVLKYKAGVGIHYFEMILRKQSSR